MSADDKPPVLRTPEQVAEGATFLGFRLCLQDDALASMVENLRARDAEIRAYLAPYVDAVYESKSGDTAAVRALAEACEKIGGAP